MAEKSATFETLGSMEEKLAFVRERIDAASAEVFAYLPGRIQEQLLLDRDSHGNVQVSKIDTEQLLSAGVERLLNVWKRDGAFSGSFKVQPHFFGYEGRCAAPSNFDADYTYGLGFVAASLIAFERSGYLASLGGLAGSHETWRPGGVPLTSLMQLEMRKGKPTPVIAKALVDLEGAPFGEFAENRESWAVEDRYRYPGPIQYFGPDGDRRRDDVDAAAGVGDARLMAKLVYSSGPDGRSGAADNAAGRGGALVERDVAAHDLRVRRDRSGRKGKTVTVAGPFYRPRDEVTKLAKELKQALRQRRRAQAGGGSPGCRLLRDRGAGRPRRRGDGAAGEGRLRVQAFGRLNDAAGGRSTSRASPSSLRDGSVDATAVRSAGHAGDRAVRVAEHRPARRAVAQHRAVLAAVGAARLGAQRRQVERHRSALGPGVPQRVHPVASRESVSCSGR